MFRTCICVVLLLAGAPLSAAQLLKQMPAQLATDKAYAFVELYGMDERALPGAIVLARYDPAAGDVRGGMRAPQSALADGEAVRITIAKKHLIKTKGSRLYLVELEPDVWVIEGASGTAFSLGSKSFRVEAGDVVDLGVLTPRTDWRDGDGPQSVGKVLAGAILFGALAGRPDPTPAMLEMRTRSAADIAIPALAPDKVRPVAYEQNAKFGNYLGGLVNRIGGRKDRPGQIVSEVSEPLATSTSQPAEAPSVDDRPTEQNTDANSPR